MLLLMAACEPAVDCAPTVLVCVAGEICVPEVGDAYFRDGDGSVYRCDLDDCTAVIEKLIGRCSEGA